MTPSAQAVERGEAVAVPREPTRDHMALLLTGEMTVGAKWSLLLAASPYAEKEPQPHPLSGAMTEALMDTAPLRRALGIDKQEPTS